MAAPVAHQEGRLVVPPVWHDRVLPRRSNGFRLGFRPDANVERTVRGVMKRLRRDLLAHLEEPGNDRRLAEAAKERLAGSRDPTGTAAVLTLLGDHWERRPGGRDEFLTPLRTRDLFSLLVLRYGLPFAIATAVEMLGIEKLREHNGVRRRPWQMPLLARPAERMAGWGGWQWRHGALGPIRSMLAECDAEEYEAVAARVARHRDTPIKRLASAYLLPDQRHWVREALAGRFEYMRQDGFESVLLATASSPEHLRAAGWDGFAHPRIRPESVAELVAGVGVASLPYLVSALESLDGLDGDGRALLTEGIAAIDSERAAAYLRTRDSRHRSASETAALPVASPSELPRLLTAPPWNRRRGRPTVIEGLKAPTGVRLVPSGAELERWRAPEVPYHSWGEDQLWAQIERWLRSPSSTPGYISPDLAGGALLRVGSELEGPLVAQTRHDPVLWPALVPIESLQAARVAADWLVRLRHGRRVACEWFDRHGERAAVLLIPDAMGRLGKRRRNAETALIHLAGRVGAEAVTRAAASYGPHVAEAVDALLDDDPADPWTMRPPPVGDWYEPAALPPILTADLRSRLSREAVDHVVMVMRLWSPWNDYRGADVLTAHCDEHSLARFSWALFEQWWRAGHPGRSSWAVLQLVRFGGPDASGRLAALARRSQSSTVFREVIETLTAIGDGEAMRAMYDLSRLGLSATAAAGVVERAAERRGLDTEQLLDRTLVAPRIPADTEHFVSEQARRLEEAMVGARTWSTEAFERYIAGRAVTGDLARRLLWTVEADGGRIAFRIAEDGSYADADDGRFELPPESVVRLAHPVLLGPDLAAWSDIFADYRILQPFAQLARPLMALTPEESATGALARFKGVSFGTTGLLNLFEYDRLTVLQTGNDPRQYHPMLWRPVPGGHLLAQPDRHIVGFSSSQAPTFSVTLEDVRFNRTRNFHPDAREPLHGEQIDPVIVAEILARLTDARCEQP